MIVVILMSVVCLIVCNSWCAVLGFGWRSFSSLCRLSQNTQLVSDRPGHTLILRGCGKAVVILAVWGACVVLLQGDVGVLLEVGHDFRRQHLVDVSVHL